MVMIVGLWVCRCVCEIGMDVCVYVCMGVWMYVCVCMGVCMYVWYGMYVCVCDVYVCVYVSVRVIYVVL